MKKGQICEGIAEYVDFPNKAIVVTKEKDADGKEIEYRVTVKGALPGQTVKYVVKKARRDKCQGRLLEVVKKSPLETVEPVCPKFGICGGCNYQSLPYEEQLKLKKNQVLKLINNALREVPEDFGSCSFIKHENKESSCNNDEKLFESSSEKQNDENTSHEEQNNGKQNNEKISNTYLYDGILSSPETFGYRNKMEFSFGDEYKGGPIALGLHKKGSIHDIVNASGCKIVHDDYSKVLDCVREYFLEREIPHYNKNTHTGVLRYLLVRRAASTGELLVALVTSSQMELELEELSRKLQNLKLEGSLTGFLHIINDGMGDVVKSDETHIIYGKDWFTEEILGLKFKISTFSFFQTNTKGAEVLYSRARDYILENFIEKSEKISTNSNTDLYMNTNTSLSDKVVFDLYSGTGTIAQIIAPVAKKVIGVEIVEEAVEAAKRNAAYNGLDNCEFIAGDVLKVLDEIEEKPDFIILDPPREGIHPKALKKIIGYGVEKIVYISCKPTSLAKDLMVFVENGYRLDRVSNVDLFCNTVHVESVCLLHRRDL